MLRWSDRPALALYALAAGLAVLELAILWQALRPNVPPEFAAYYIDRTTTCLPQPVTGAYTLGDPVDFRSGGDPTRELRPCGWDGPAGDGMHSVGETSRLRFAVSEPGALTLTLELTGVTLPGPETQTVLVFAGERQVAEWRVMPGMTETFRADIPAGLADGGHLDIRLDYPDAINPGKGVANTYWRSVKLTAAQLTPTD